MKTLLRVLLTTLPLVAAAGQLAAQPPKGSQLPEDKNNCAKCHGEPGIWDSDKLRFYVPKESLAEDVHLKHGVNCHDCHGGNPGTFDFSEAHAKAVGRAQHAIS